MSKWGSRGSRGVSFNVRSKRLACAPGARRAIMAADAGMRVDPDAFIEGDRVMVGAMVSSAGGWLAWRRIAPRSLYGDAGSAVAELIGAREAVGSTGGHCDEVLLLTDNATVKAHLRRCIGDDPSEARPIVGNKIALRKIAAPERLSIKQVPRNHPFIQLADRISRIMYPATLHDRPRLEEEIDVLVRTTLNLDNFDERPPWVFPPFSFPSPLSSTAAPPLRL